MSAPESQSSQATAPTSPNSSNTSSITEVNTGSVPYSDAAIRGYCDPCPGNIRATSIWATSTRSLQKSVRGREEDLTTPEQRVTSPVLADHHGGVETALAAPEHQSGLDLAVPRFVHHEVELVLRHDVLDVDGGRDRRPVDR